MRALTNRQRLFAVLHGRELDRVPFVQYDNTAAPIAQLWSAFGRDAVGRLHWTDAHSLSAPHCGMSVSEFMHDGVVGRRTLLSTPKGILTEEALIQPTYGTASIKKHYIKEKGDWETFLCYLRDIVVVPRVECLLAADRDLGDDGLPHVSALRTPYQHLWIHCVALEDLVAALTDWPDLTAGVISELARIERDIFAILAGAPVPYVVIPDNITAPVIGERWFSQFCLPLYREISAMMAERGIPVFVHMDGDLKPLWLAIGESGIGGIDSLSPPPDNDTSAGEAARMWPGMRLFVNFPSSVHVAAPRIIRRTASEILSQAGHTGRLSLQVSENVPPGVWRKSFPPIIEAIREFGKP